MSRLPKNSLKLGIGSIIKIGRLEITITSAMFILDNGSCHQLCRRDGDSFYYRDYTHYSNIQIPKKLIKAIDFSVLNEVPYKGISNSTDYSQYKAYKFKNL